MTQNLISLLGLFVLMGLAWLLCDEDRRHVDFRVIVGGVIIQLFFAVIVFYFEPGRQLFLFLNDAVVKLLDFTTTGAEFVFNALAIPPAPDGSNVGFGFGKSLGFFFAFQVLTTIIFFSSLMAILYYLGVMQKIVLMFAKIMTRIMGVSGAESLSASANVFVGQTEAPLVVRPYVASMTRSELMAVMTGGMATVAGGVMAAYVGLLKGSFPNIAGHLISASVLSAPAALVMAKLMVPETAEPATAGTVKMDLPQQNVNILDAAASGASDGMTLAFNVGAMLIAFVALIEMMNFGFAELSFLFQTDWGFEFWSIMLCTFILSSAFLNRFNSPLNRSQIGWLVFILFVLETIGYSLSKNMFEISTFSEFFRMKSVLVLNGVCIPLLFAAWLRNQLAEKISLWVPLTTLLVFALSVYFFLKHGPMDGPLKLEVILGWIFYPFAWIMGVPAVDCLVVGRLLGEKIILTEFIAYLNLSTVLQKGLIEDPRSVVIATYALCGFANFASIAIQIGGIGGIAPNRRGDLAKLGIKAVIAGSLAAFMTASVAGVFYREGEERILLPEKNTEATILQQTPPSDYQQDHSNSDLTDSVVMPEDFYQSPMNKSDVAQSISILSRAPDVGTTCRQKSFGYEQRILTMEKERTCLMTKDWTG